MSTSTERKKRKKKSIREVHHSTSTVSSGVRTEPLFFKKGTICLLFTMNHSVRVGVFLSPFILLDISFFFFRITKGNQIEVSSCHRVGETTSWGRRRRGQEMTRRRDDGEKCQSEKKDRQRVRLIGSMPSAHLNANHPSFCLSVSLSLSLSLSRTHTYMPDKQGQEPAMTDKPSRWVSFTLHSDSFKHD